MPDLSVVVIAGFAAFLGAIVQGGVGFGLGLIAGPVITMLDPTLMPGCALVLGTVLPALTLVREPGRADRFGLRWALAGRAVGTVAGVAVLTLLSPRLLGVAVGVMVLVTVALPRSLRVPRNRGTLVAAGLVAGTTSASTSISGPPIALLYQREKGPLVRRTLAVFFCLGALAALVALGVGHQLRVRQVTTGLMLVPFLVAGLAASGPLRRYLDGGRTRAAVVVLAGASAVALIVRSLA